MTMVGLYVRLSFDPEAMKRSKDGIRDPAEFGPGLTRQQEDAESLAKRRGWETALYPDESASAYKRRVRREHFERLLEDLATGAIDGVVVYDIDRLARQPRDLERLIDLFEANPKLVFATCQGDIDLAISDGRTLARLLVTVANKSSADTGRRVARVHFANAQMGKPVGGKRPFGWEDDKRTIRPAEAELIRTAVADIVDRGKGISTIAREWREAGITTPSGKPWCRQVVKEVLLSPRLAGMRVYRTQIAVDKSGRPVKGTHEAILSDSQWQALRAVLADPARSGKHVHVGGRKYLLSGVARCAKCGALMRGNADRRAGHNYQCGGCNGVASNGPKTDQCVAAVVMALLKDHEVKRGPEVWPEEAQLADATQRIAELMASYTAKQLSGAVVFPAVAELELEQNELRSRRAAWLREQLVAVTPSNALELWPQKSVHEQRKIVESLIQSVVISPPTVRGNRFDENRIEVFPREPSQSGTTARPSPEQSG